MSPLVLHGEELVYGTRRLGLVSFFDQSITWERKFNIEATYSRCNVSQFILYKSGDSVLVLTIHRPLCLLIRTIQT